MDNAVSALKIVFAILVFIIALSITLTSIAQVKKTSDFILYHIDKTNYYTRLSSGELETTNGGRKVKIDTVLSMLYKIKQESFEVQVIEGNKIFNFGLNTMTGDELEEEIEAFKTDYIDKNYEYIETFSEVVYTGHYITAEDGSQITKTPGIKKIYITYTKIN